MKDNHKTLMKISLGLIIIGLERIKSTPNAESRFVGSSEPVAQVPTASNAETAGDVCQTVHITLLNSAGEEWGRYEVDRNATLSQFVNANGLHGQFVLPGALEKLNPSRVISDILQFQGTTQESDVLTLQYVPYITWSLDFSLLNTKDLPGFTITDLQLSSTLSPEGRAIKMDNRRKCIKYVEDKLGLRKDPNIKMDLLAFRATRTDRILLYVTNGDNLEYLYNVPVNEAPRVSYHGTMDPIILKMFQEGDNIAVFLNGPLNSKVGKVVQNKPSTDNPSGGYMTINCDNNFYRCVYIDNEYVVVSIRNEPVKETLKIPTTPKKPHSRNYYKPRNRV